MNKKIKSFIAIMIVLKSVVAFSAQENKVFDQVRYDEISKLYHEKKLTQENIKSGDSFYFLASLQEEIERDDDILEILKNFES